MNYTVHSFDERGNTVVCDFNYQDLSNFRLVINGSNNSVTFFSKPLLRGNLVVNINADNCNVNLGNNITCQKNVFISLLPSGKGSPSSNLKCYVGDNTVFNGLTSIVLAEENNEVVIGSDCLFADNVSISTSDSHKIFSTETGERINYAQSVYIGNHVWIGEGVRILKNSVVLSHSICAAGSVINKRFDTGNVILAGIPAKIVREKVDWSY